ncbi:MAG: arginine--tRNA ligase, partial [Lachnospiraceae bacterium]|nr:arginine--tRNA ligase [Candidatus Minthocola equi]
AFTSAGYSIDGVRAVLSNRPDLAEYQCNSAMAAAKVYHKAPLQIADEVVSSLNAADDGAFFESATAAAPGFINLTLAPAALADYLNQISSADKYGISGIGAGQTAIIDYGGPNVAKPLHVGHLRAAVIGESIKRILNFNGYKTIGDVHLGDWGLQMGLIIAELSERQPELPYFNDNYQGDYPAEAPFTISDLEEIYPTASGRAKTDEAFAAKAHEATALLQQGHRGYTALFRHIINVSVNDLKKNYTKLDVNFELWNGESDAQKYIPDMLSMLREKDLMHESEGAQVVDVALPDDSKEIPPCIILKKDGASLYATTDLATLVQRERDFAPDHVIYVVDKRQDMHFVQVFRVAKKAGIIPEDTDLTFIGFGTMNGRDGKPFKTREGGVMRLENLISEINSAVKDRMTASGMDESEITDETAGIIGLAALKYGDLSNQATKDYVFDTERFSSFEGNTGPYILYTMVRIKSILRKYTDNGGVIKSELLPASSPSEKAVQLLAARAGDVIEGAARELAPHRICQYIYELSNAFNSFYHEVKILAETDEDKKAGYIALLSLILRVLNDCIYMLGFSAPERM